MMENEFAKKWDSAVQKFNQWSPKKKIITCGSVILVFLLILLATKTPQKSETEKPAPPEHPEVTVVTFDLKEVINTSVVNIASYPCNGVAEWTESSAEEETKQIAYIEYKGNVKFSFDFSNIQISEPDEGKDITIVLPEITRSANLELSSFYCIFLNSDVKKQYNNSNTYQEKVYTVCKNDMLKKLNSSVNASVSEYAKEYIAALVDPILSANGYTYTVIVGGVK